MPPSTCRGTCHGRHSAHRCRPAPAGQRGTGPRRSRARHHAVADHQLHRPGDVPAGDRADLPQGAAGRRPHGGRPQRRRLPGVRHRRPGHRRGAWRRRRGPHVRQRLPPPWRTRGLQRRRHRTADDLPVPRLGLRHEGQPGGPAPARAVRRHQRPRRHGPAGTAHGGARGHRVLGADPRRHDGHRRVAGRHAGRAGAAGTGEGVPPHHHDVAAERQLEEHGGRLPRRLPHRVPALVEPRPQAGQQPQHVGSLRPPRAPRLRQQDHRRPEGPAGGDVGPAGRDEPGPLRLPQRVDLRPAGPGHDGQPPVARAVGLRGHGRPVPLQPRAAGLAGQGAGDGDPSQALRGDHR